MQCLGGETHKGEGLNQKKLDKIRGFLVYVSRKYPPMNPYLKGIHLTFDQWREDRDEDEWHLSE